MPSPLTNALMTTAAVIDRLVHHSVILEMTGTSVQADAAEQRQCSFDRWNMMSTRFSKMPRVATSAARPIARNLRRESGHGPTAGALAPRVEAR